MKRRTFIRIGLLACLGAVLLMPLLLMAQVPPLPPAPGGTTTTGSTWLPVGWENLVIALVVPVLLAGAKKWLSPDSANLSDTAKKILVIAAPILGAIGAAVAGFFGAPIDVPHLASGAVFGGATGIGLREIGDQVILKPMRKAAQAK